MQPVEVALPQDPQTVGIVIFCEVRDQQIQVVCQLTLLNAHLPVTVIVFIVVFPFQTDAVILHIFQSLRLTDVLFRPWLPPGESEYAVLLCHVIGYPPLKAVGAADLFPHEVWRLRVQGVFDVNSLFSHTLRAGKCVSFVRIMATKLQKFFEIQNIFSKKFW